MKFARTLVFSLAIAATGCATVQKSVPPPPVSGADLSISALADLPKNDHLPEQSAVAPGTKYVFIQSGGGNILLGPIFGSMNISANTKAMAEQYSNSVLAIDPTSIASDAMARAAGSNAGNAAAFSARPFVFVQHCYDEKFRLSLVFHVEGGDQSPPWVGRYTYHLPTSYAVSSFASLSAEELDKYRAELATGADILTDLMRRDLTGDLPATGERANFGSLYLIGSKLGGMGIYTMPEELHFNNAQVIEQTDSHVTVRLPGNMHATVLAGGLAYGVHRIDKSLVHTLKPL